MKPYLFIPVVFVILLGCNNPGHQLYPADHEFIRYTGRVDNENPSEPLLIGSAAFAELSFTGDSCVVLLRNIASNGNHNYVAMELNGVYLGRTRIDGSEMGEHVVRASASKTPQILRIYKASEAQNGYVAFGGVKSERLNKLADLPSRKIEFIGNSITCAMGADLSETPCESGEWYDQHNAYFSYARLVANAMDAQFLLSSVSGIGIYRNWNSDGPVMPDVYENLYLDTNDSKKWEASDFSPDLISICLGTNDFSEGDGMTERLPFDSAQYVDRYIAFIGKLMDRHPNAKICLIDSPMLGGANKALLASCLDVVKNHFAPETNLSIFLFDEMQPKGCSWHPSKEDHEKMAKELLPFYRNVMGWEQ